jgi:hypothetical protein
MVLMIITVSTPMKGKEIIELLEGSKGEGATFKFIGKTGLRHEFEATGIEADAAVALAKKLIKSQPYGGVLYFSVTAGK